jgi:hypothetical protein
MQPDFETTVDRDQPLQRGRLDEEGEEEQDPEREMMRATQFEFRDSVPLPGDPVS